MNRIDFLASLAKNSNTLLDIGCDHAYTLIKAIKEYGVKKGIAADISKYALSMAYANIKKYDLLDKIEIVLSDGLDNINNEFDTAILSGMGGSLIIDIVSRGLDKLRGKRLIISSQSDQYLVRKFLSENDFYIVDEDAFYDNDKYYEVMVISYGRMNYPSLDLKYGPILLKKRNEAFLNHLEKEKNNLILALSNIKDENSKKEVTKKIKEIDVIIDD